MIDLLVGGMTLHTTHAIIGRRKKGTSTQLEWVVWDFISTHEWCQPYPNLDLERTLESFIKYQYEAPWREDYPYGSVLLWPVPALASEFAPARRAATPAFLASCFTNWRTPPARESSCDVPSGMLMVHGVNMRAATRVDMIKFECTIADFWVTWLGLSRMACCIEKTGSWTTTGRLRGHAFISILFCCLAGAICAITTGCLGAPVTSNM
jgi:hypothetical protein